jgi:hypothetical protein
VDEQISLRLLIFNFLLSPAAQSGPAQRFRSRSAGSSVSNLTHLPGLIRLAISGPLSPYTPLGEIAASPVNRINGDLEIGLWRARELEDQPRCFSYRFAYRLASFYDMS